MNIHTWLKSVFHVYVFLQEHHCSVCVLHWRDWQSLFYIQTEGLQLAFSGPSSWNGTAHRNINQRHNYVPTDSFFYTYYILNIYQINFECIDKILSYNFITRRHNLIFHLCGSPLSSVLSGTTLRLITRRSWLWSRITLRLRIWSTRLTKLLWNCQLMTTSHILWQTQSWQSMMNTTVSFIWAQVFWIILGEIL